MGTALVTGASSGLGKEFARLFARDGHSLILVARRRDRLEAVAKELRSKNSAIQVQVLEADLGKPGAGTDLFRKVEALGAKIDFLVNNAGYGSGGRFVDLDIASELQMVDLNVRSLLELTHCFLPGMLKRNSGRILNVGSTAGFQPGPFMATYYATKAFVNSFSEALHEELHGTNVTCTVLAPGATATEFAAVAGQDKTTLFNPKRIATATQVAASGYNAMMRGRALAIPGLMNNIMVQSLRFSPRAMVRKIVVRMHAPR